VGTTLRIYDQGQERLLASEGWAALGLWARLVGCSIALRCYPDRAVD